MRERRMFGPSAAGGVAARADLLLAGMAAGGVAAVGAALASQHVWGMQPCAWCVLQRLLFLLLSAGAVLGLVWRSATGRRAGAALALAMALGGGAAALWQHFVAVPTGSCDLSLAERLMAALGLDARLPEVFMAMATCAEAAVDLLGVPYEFWSLGLFALMAGAALAVLRRPG